MPKSKKKKNADFQKVKLKVGKRLPKGGNETNLSFKSRTLKVTQVLKDHSKPGNQPQTRKKLTLEELMKQCNANKTCSQRLSAVEGLRELLLSDAGKDAVLSSLGQVMEKVSGLLSDTEPTVRQAVQRLCRTVFTQISSEKHGFFDYMSAQLCCAMNNISDDVRQDSLTLFDMLLEKFPQQVIGAYSNLVPTLVGQISSQMMTGGKVMTLVCNPNSRLSSQQWRAQVLQRLKTIVEACVEKYREVEAPMDEEAEVFYSGEKFPVIRGPTVHPCVRRMWTDPYNQKYEHKFNTTRQEYADLTRNEKCLQKFISSLMPLIKQCWIEEFCSDGATVTVHNAADTGRQLSEKSLPMVKCLVGLLHAFVECWRCVYIYNNKQHKENCWFRGEFLQYMKELLLPKFPIYVMEKAHKGQKGPPAKQSALQLSLLKLNLQICEALAGLGSRDARWPECDVLPRESWHKDIISFLLKNLKLCGGAELSKCAVSVLQRVFFHFPATEKLGKLLAKAQKRFIKAHPLSTERKAYLVLFDSLAFDPHQESPYHAVYRERHEQLRPYFESLPGLLLQLGGMENGEALASHVTKCMCRNGSRLLTASMHQHMEQLLDAKTGVFATLPQSCHGDMVLAIKWAYHDQPAPETVLELVELVCRLPQVSRETADRLVSGLHSKYSALLTKKQFLECKNDYLRFFLTILVGHKRVELESYHSQNKPEVGGLTRILWSATAEQMEKHAFIVKKCVRNFFPYLESPSYLYGTQMLEVMADTWTNKILSKYKAVSVFTAYSTLAHWVRMIGPLESYDEFIHVDHAPTPPQIRSVQGIKMMRRHLGELLPRFKARMRPFTKLAFSAAYSIVSMETSGEGIAADSVVVNMLWGAVMGVLVQSLRMLLDLCQVVTDFVRAERSEEQSMKTVIVMTRVLSSRHLSDLLRNYQATVKERVEDFTVAVKDVTPHVEDKSWWQEFLRASV